MQFEWDENKNNINLNKHKIDFNFVIKVFDDNNRIEWQDERNDYGEQRFITIGKILVATFVVVYTVRDMAFRIISARAAKKQERDLYDNMQSVKR